MSAGSSWPNGRNVSRETLERLEHFVATLRKWNPKINLVASSTLGNVWQRHIDDSIQVFDLAPSAGEQWADLGSGGGFPGIVAAILSAAERPEMMITLVESDKRKAAFLNTVIKELGLHASVLAERIESVPPLAADILSARALAPLPDLLAYAEKHMSPGGAAIFPKGIRHVEEIERALEDWRFTLQKIPSKTDPSAVVLLIGGIARV